jgi:HSP20 family protein
MALVRWGTSPELASLLGSFFDTPTRTASASPRRWQPAMDVAQTDDHYILRADLPGVAEDDIAVEVRGDVLTVSGERRHEAQQAKGGYLRVERATGAFSRTLTLPEGVDADGVEASFDRGVLEVRIPKPAERKPRRVEIAVGGAEPKTIEAA